MEEWKDRAQRYQRHIAVGAVVLAWGIAFRWGFAGSDWGGEWWGSAPPTRGDSVVIKERQILTDADRQGRLAKEKKELGDTLRELKEAARRRKRELVGDGRKTQGNDIHHDEGIDDEAARWTQREMCQNLKLEYPDKFGDVDCMDKEYDDSDTWLRAPRKPGQ